MVSRIGVGAMLEVYDEKIFCCNNCWPQPAWVMTFTASREIDGKPRIAVKVILLLLKAAWKFAVHAHDKPAYTRGNCVIYTGEKIVNSCVLTIVLMD